jgi:hypothetical protein
MSTHSLKTTAALYFVVPHVSHDPHHILLFFTMMVILSSKYTLISISWVLCVQTEGEMSGMRE